MALRGTRLQDIGHRARSNARLAHTGSSVLQSYSAFLLKARLVHANSQLHAQVPEAVVREVLDGAEEAKVDQFALRSFVDDNK